MELRTILLGVVAVIILYMLLQYFNKSGEKTIYSSLKDATKQETIGATSVPNSGSINYTYSLWFYINDWNYRYGEDKVIVNRLDTDGGSSPMIRFTPNINNLAVDYTVYDENTGNAKTSTCILENIPLQRWTHLVVTLNNRALDIYIDGKLVKTCVLSGVVKQSNPNSISVTPGGGFAGFISNFKIIGNAITPQKAYELYKEGNGQTGMFNQFGVKMSLVKGTKEVKSFQI